MNYDGDPPGRDPDPKAGGSLNEVERRQYALQQQMMEAKLEIIRSHRQQKEARVSRVVFFVFVFGASALVAFVMDAKGYTPAQSIGSCVVVLVVIGTWWIYRKPY
jgi:hypothetical protein